MPGRTKKTQDSEPLDIALPRIFEQVQSSAANHQKNFVALRKLHVEAAAEVKEIQKGRGLQLVGEAAFQNAFLEVLVRILPVKKGVVVADRVVRFIGGYIKHIHKKAEEDKQGDDGDEDEDDTMETRFVGRLLEVLFKGFVAKDKSVRYRSVFLVAEMVAHMGELDEDLYQKLRTSLLERVYDKETPVRVQAVIGLSKLCGSETDEDTAEGEQTATEVLIEIIGQDPAADVRRAVLCNIPITGMTLPAVLERTRDMDTTIRRLVFSLVLLVHAKNPGEDEEKTEAETIGVAHPRALQIAQRELIVRHGLGDREEVVRAAAAKVLRAWVDVAADPQANTGPANIEQDLLAFLRMFDLGADQTAEDALTCIYTTRPEILDLLAFDDAFWNAGMTPEKAFLVRVFTKYCVTQKEEARLEGKLPVVTGFAFKIQGFYNKLRQLMESDLDHDVDEEAQAAREEARMDLEFVLGEMLRIAMYLDYGDEMGRRRMFQLVKDMISQESLPSELTPRCLDVLRKLTPNEKELIRIVVEVVQDLRDLKAPEDDDQDPSGNVDEAATSFGTPARPRTQPKQAPEDMSPEDRKRSDALDMRCLVLCIAMLERVNSTFEDNSTLQGLLRELIIPSVQRKELDFREKGLYCLALCCMIARRMARQSFGLFMSQVQPGKKTPESLKLRVLQAIFDIIMIHEQDFLDKGSDKYQEVVSFFMETLNHEDTTPQVEALVCVGLSKLVLSRMVVEDAVLQSMVLVYVSPHTQDNQQLRQCLSYFFPIFCYSSSTNQRQLQNLFIPIFELHQEKAEEDREDMISPLQFAGMFIDWTDPHKAVDTDHHKADPHIHFDMASEVMRALLGDTLDKDYKKALCQILSKLSIPDKVDDDDRVRTLKLLLHHVQSKRPLKDTVAKNALTKFDAMLSKKFDEQLKDFSEDDYRKLENLQSLFDFLDDVVPEDGDENVSKKKTTRKRRSESVVSRASDQDEAPSKSKRKPAIRKGAKRRRVSSPGGDSDSSEVSPDETPRAPRNLPKRAAAKKRASLVEPDPGEEEEEEEEDASDSPAPAPRTRKPADKRQEESKLDEELDNLLTSDEEPEASVVDESDED